MENETVGGIDRFCRHIRRFGNCCDPLTQSQITQEVDVFLTELLWTHEFGLVFAQTANRSVGLSVLPEYAGELIPLSEAYRQFAQFVQARYPILEIVIS